MHRLSVNQVEFDKDLLATEIDIKNLRGIVDGLTGFAVTNTGGEDRKSLEIDLFKFRGLLREAEELRGHMLKYAAHYGLTVTEGVK